MNSILQSRLDGHILIRLAMANRDWRWLQRGLHNIDDELVFEKHDGYVFHDSRGFECGSEDELKIVQAFVRRKACETRLKDRLHAIWCVSFRDLQLRFCEIVFRFCVPMDNDRPSLDLEHIYQICPDENGMSKFNYMNWDWHLTPGILQVPLMALFTKYDQFRRNIKVKLIDKHDHPITETHVKGEAKSVFEQHYTPKLHERSTPFICLESEEFVTDWPIILLISVLQTCTTNANYVLIWLIWLPIHSLVAWLNSCLWLCRRTTWKSAYIMPLNSESL